MKMTILKGRQFGKTAFQMQLNQLNSYWHNDPYTIHHQWTSSSGEEMYQLSIGAEVFEWLNEEQSQYGIKNPDWWKVNGKYNMKASVFTMLSLKFAK